VSQSEFDLQLKSIREALGRYRTRADHRFADVVAHAFLREVVEFSRSTRALTRSRNPRTAYATARVAFEAAQDLAFLCSKSESYEERAALVHASELVEMEDLQERFRRADVAAEYSKGRLAQLPSPEDAIERDASALDKRKAGAGAILRAALKEMRKPNRARKHWSGLSRKAIGRELAQEHPDIKLVYEVGDNFYGYLSINTHPRLRWTIEPRLFARNNTVVVQRRAVDRTLPLDLAGAAIVLAIAALTWSGRRVKVYFDADTA
jgi:hypothetical protein